MQAMGLKSKNDTIDARGLALMGSQQKLDTWQPLSKFITAIPSSSKLAGSQS